MESYWSHAMESSWKTRKVADSECEAGGLFNGKRLGNSGRIAVYNIEGSARTTSATYKKMTNGSTSTCPRVTSLAECSAAAAAMGLWDISATADGQHGVSHDPPYCYAESGSLKFNLDGSSTGSCTSTDTCVCKASSTGPPPPPLGWAPGSAFASGCVCDDTCLGNNNERCEDGGPGSQACARGTDCGHNGCARGTDCTDCGPSNRTKYDYKGTFAPHVSYLSTCHCDDTCKDHHDGHCDDGGPGSRMYGCVLGTDCWDCGPSNCTGEELKGAKGAATCVHVDRCANLGTGFGTNGNSALAGRHAYGPANVAWYWMVHPRLGWHNAYRSYTSNTQRPGNFASGNYNTNLLCGYFFKDLADPAVGEKACGKTYPAHPTLPYASKTVVLDCGNRTKNQPRVTAAHAILSVCVKTCMEDAKAGKGSVCCFVPQAYAHLFACCRELGCCPDQKRRLRGSAGVAVTVTVQVEVESNSAAHSAFDILLACLANLNHIGTCGGKPNPSGHRRH